MSVISQAAVSTDKVEERRGFKESHMSHKPSTAGRTRRPSIAYDENADVILEGRFLKQGEAGSFTRANWKERHFELTAHSITYFEKKVRAAGLGDQRARE